MALHTDPVQVKVMVAGRESGVLAPDQSRADPCGHGLSGRHQPPICLIIRLRLLLTIKKGVPDSRALLGGCLALLRDALLDGPGIPGR